MTSKDLFSFDRGFDKPLIIGTDEAGRGPGAGGVFASAVYFKSVDNGLIKELSALNDSKKLSKKVRGELYVVILENTINSTVCIEVEEIEKINILNASLKAMKLACENVIKDINTNVILNSFQDLTNSLHEANSGILILVDGNKLIKDFYPSSALPAPSPPRGEGRVSTSVAQQFIIKGDSKSASIAAASILAKVSRDRYMEELDKKFPEYNWVQNAGYLTREHLSAIDKYGITPCHRESFLRKYKERCNTVQLNLYQK